MPIAIDRLHVCEPVLSCSKAKHRRCPNIPEAPPPLQRYSYTNDITRQNAPTPTSWALGKGNCGFLNLGFRS